MAITTPPFRTSLLTANGAPFATDNGDIQTTKDWWLYWNQLTDRSNSNSRLAVAGTHADRPMPESMPDGALYYENDRGVLYAATLGVWQYVAGTMYGTLSPDRRPTDLGTHDAGFEFRGTDAARQFLWSQTAWVEVTAVQYGPHAARPNPATIVEGALYVESDRGGVIYQRETPAGTPLWQYLAGTMWGTLVPDQRPTDLGTHDAGFDFRTNVAPPREFIWNQTAWVEVSAQTNTFQLAVGTTVLTLTTAAQNVPGCVLTLALAGVYLVIGIFDFTNTNDTGQVLIGGLSASSASVALFQTTGTSGNRATFAQQWMITVAAGTVINLTANKTGGTGTSNSGGGHTTISALWVAS